MNKKRFFSTVLAMLIAGSMSVGVLSGCDDDEPNGGGANGNSTTEQPANDGSGDSVADDPIEGVWSGATLDDGLFWMSGSTTDTFTATVDLFEDALHDGYVVVKATETNGTDSMDIYIAMGVDKEGDEYKGTFVVDDPTDPYTFSAKIEDGKLIAKVVYTQWFSGEVTKTLTFSTKTDFPDAIDPEGTFYFDNAFLPYGFDFAAKTVKVNGQSLPAHIYHIGEYISVMTTTNATDDYMGIIADIGFTVLKKGTGYVAYSVITALSMDEEDGIALVDEAPAFSATVNFELGKNAAANAVKPKSVTLTSPSEKFTLPDAPAAAEGYMFVGWKEYDESYGTVVGDAGSKVSLMDRGIFETSVTLYARFEPIRYEVKLNWGDVPISEKDRLELEDRVAPSYMRDDTPMIGVIDASNIHLPIGIYANEETHKIYRLSWTVGVNERAIPATGSSGSVLFTLTKEIADELGLKIGSAVVFNAVWTEVTE